LYLLVSFISSAIQQRLLTIIIDLQVVEIVHKLQQIIVAHRADALNRARAKLLQREITDAHLVG